MHITILLQKFLLCFINTIVKVMYLKSLSHIVLAYKLSIWKANFQQLTIYLKLREANKSRVTLSLSHWSTQKTYLILK